MLRKDAVLAVTWLALPAVAAARELPIAELAGAPLVSASPSLAASAPKKAQPMARLVWLDPASAAFGTEAVVRPEVTRLLREMGVAASWRRGEPHELARAGELRVIFLNRAAQRPHGAPVLGATPTSFVSERFVWVHVPSVRAAAGVSSQRTAPALDVHSARRLGIALARVIAHEVVHALAPSLPHGGGLMSARLDRNMLTAPRISVDPEVGLAVRNALLLPLSVAETSDMVLAVESPYKEPYR